MRENAYFNRGRTSGIEMQGRVGMLEKNMGGVDRASRIGLGVALIASAAVGALGSWAYIGIVPVVTGLIGSCPAYTLFGFKTCKTLPPAN